MNDKTRGEYKRTTPDPDETTGEALARLQAKLTRLLDEADAELRDEADGGVAAALIEKEAEQPLTFADRLGAASINARQAREAEKDTKHLRERCAELEHRLNLAVKASEHNAERADKAERERDEARADLAEYVQAQALRTHPSPLTPDAEEPPTVTVHRAADPDHLYVVVEHPGFATYQEKVHVPNTATATGTPDAMTAREHLDAAWEAAHVPADGIIPEGRMFLDRGSAGVVVVGAAGNDLASRGSSWERRLVDPPTPARPEGAEDIDEHLRQANAAALGGALTLEQRRALADHLAGFGYRNPLDRAEDGAA